MAKPCRYQIKGQDTWMSEAEFKKALNDGLLDTFLLENQVSIPSLKGFKPDSGKIESYKLGRGKGGKMTEDTNLRQSTSGGVELTKDGVEAYHSTYADFDQFDPNKSSENSRDFGFHFGSTEAAKKRAEDVADANRAKGEEAPSESSSKTIKAKLNIKNPLRLSEDRMGDFSPVSILRRIFTSMDESGELLDGFTQEEVDSFFNDNLQFETSVKDASGNKLPTNILEIIGGSGNIDKQSEVLREYLESKGYDGLVYNNEFEGGGDSYVAFSPEQIEITEKKPTFKQTYAASESSFLNGKRGDEIDSILKSNVEDYSSGFLNVFEAYDQLSEEEKSKFTEKEKAEIANLKSQWQEESKKYKRLPVERAKSFAAKIRAGKIDTKGLAMSSIPGLNEAWNTALEVAAVTVETAGEAADAIGKGIAAAEKSFKESEFYKSLKTREERLRYFNDLRNNIEQALTEKKMTGKEKAAAKEFGQTVNEVTGVKPVPKMITAKESDLLKARIKAQAASSRDTAKNLNDMKEEVRKFAKENLPKDVYTAREVGAVLSAITKAKTEKSVNDAIDKIQALSERKVEAARVAKAKDIAKTIKSKKTLYTKINDKWKGKVSVEAQQEFKDFIESLNDIESMSMDELQAVEDTINGILNEGKADLKRVKEIQDSRKRTENAKMLKELGGTPRTLTDVAAVNEFFDSVGGYVIVDGQLYNKSDFTKSAYNNKVNPATFNSAEAYDKIPGDQSRVISEETTSKVKKAGRWIKASAVLNSVYGSLQKIYKGAPEMKKFIEENISQPMKDYFVDSKIAKGKIFKEFRDGRAKIFGGQRNAAKRLDANADINPIKAMSDAGLKVKNTVLVSLYNLGKLTDGQERLKTSGVDVNMLNEYIENNPDLKEYSDFLIDQYASLRERYEPTYISIMNTTFPEGIYYPAYAAEGPIQDTFNENSIFDGETNEFKALNAMVDNLKQRTNYSGAFNTTLTSEEIFSDYVNNMERAKALVPVAKSLNQLFNEANRPYIANKIGYSELTELQRHLAVVLTGKKPISSQSTKGVDALMNWNVISTLGFKLASIPKQLASITHFWSAGIKNGINPAKVITAVPTNKAEFDFLKEVMTSDYLKERLTGSGLDVEVQRILSAKTDRQYKKALKKIFQVGMYLPAAGDWLTVTFPMGGGGSYAIAALRNELSKGKSLEEAKAAAFKQFVEAVEETQQTSREDYTSNFQREKVGRMIMTYKSAQVGAARKITEGVRTLRDSKNSSKEEKIQAFTDIVYYTAFSSMLFNLISNAGYDVFVNPLYDDDDENRVWYDLIMDQLGSVVQGFGLVGMITDWTLNASRDDKWKNNTPAMQFLSLMADAGSSFVQAISKREWNDLTDEDKDRLNDDLGFQQNLTEETYNDLKEIYRNTSINQRMSPQDFERLLKIAGAKNIMTQIDDFTEWMNGDQSFIDAFMNYEQDYFEYAKRRNKNDYLFKALFGEDYLRQLPVQNKQETYLPVISTESQKESIDER
jgi:hypothetical protein